MNKPDPKKPDPEAQPTTDAIPSYLKTAEIIARAIDSLKISQPYNTADWSKLISPSLASSYLYPNLLKSLKLSQANSAPLKVSAEIAALQQQIQERLNKLSIGPEKSPDKGKLEELEHKLDELTKKQDIQHLLNSTNTAAHDKLINDESFRLLFAPTEEVSAFVVSVDIRRSTELMLKARSPKLFSGFITTLCTELDDIFKNNWAVVDKFTGDGMLAFFPEFYSGEDAGYHALKAAKECITSFVASYRKHRPTFNCVLRDIGLGIGIDYGKVHIVRMAGALTIVGQPVVYACRLSSCPPNRILLNQPAFEIISDKYAHVTTTTETSLEINHDGSLVCYDITLKGKEHLPKVPTWLKGNS